MLFLEYQEILVIKVCLFFSSHKELVKRKYEIECHVAAKYNNSKIPEAKWKPVRHCNL